ncbi:MAG TPA: efflux RND transporter periplasmic adaptor subunit [Bryobacteraceae bacterium]|nr:efflux RND transporter periplasmic adaptor subunit [Bryobacteraceae bacterium]
MNRFRKRETGGPLTTYASLSFVALLVYGLTACGKHENVRAESQAASSVGVTKVIRKTLRRQLSMSSELVPFQEIDVYAKESGYVHDLLVDYGTRVKKGQLMAVLEIPELEAQIQQDEAAVKNATEMITHAEHELNRVEAAHQPLHTAFERLNTVAKSRPGLVAQQEVDDAQGRDLAAEAQIEASKSTLQGAQSQLQAAQAKKEHDSVLFAYARITAPFEGVVTQRFANQGTLMQAGTSSSTQVIPLVRLSEDDKFRLVIPVPETYVRYIKIGEQVNVNVTSLNRTFPGKVTRFSVDVKEDTRTMHTEVDVENRDRVLVPGMYAEATLVLEEKDNAVAVPLQAIERTGEATSVDVVTPENKVDMRTVKLGIETSTDAEVLGGLAEGEMVVVGDRSGLKPGQPVRPQEVQVVSYQGQKEE